MMSSVMAKAASGYRFLKAFHSGCLSTAAQFYATPACVASTSSGTSAAYGLSCSSTAGQL
eukprot:CAMPEP_0179860138 /NCGR_PEP_ID=MMETSP0982-20121206/13448_1 /TAXON_ID=483367 /ORGANISM="non described non described, Strain CCMP 2436" /LENGTH=59 /DNA_ID=CAMNT_0021747353 /DNA_START=59 /DNA_END=235 /DNA_ORIENTATION=-